MTGNEGAAAVGRMAPSAPLCLQQHEPEGLMREGPISHCGRGGGTGLFMEMCLREAAAYVWDKTDLLPIQNIQTLAR